MRVSSENLSTILNGKKQFKIPVFQRLYQWRDERLDSFWNDLMNLYYLELEGNNSAINHFMGTIIIKRFDSSINGTQIYDVIDGQQRLTTIQILLNVFYHQFNQHDGNSFDSDNLFNKYLPDVQKYTSAEAIPEEYFKLYPTAKDRENLRMIYFNVIHNKGNFIINLIKKELTKSKRIGKNKYLDLPPILNAFSFFKEKIDSNYHLGISRNQVQFNIEINYDNEMIEFLKHKNDNEYLEKKAKEKKENFEFIKKLYNILLNKLKFVIIELEENDDPQVIFESLNDKREALTQTDLLRNLIFLKIEQQVNHGQKDEKDVNVIYNEKWQFDGDGLSLSFWRMQTNERSKPTYFEAFFRQYVLSQIKKPNDFLTNQTYIEYSKILGNKNPIEELDKINKYAEIYEYLVNPNKNEISIDFFPEVLEQMQIAKLLITNFNSRLFMPLFLFILGDDKFHETNKIFAIKHIITWHIKYYLHGLEARSANKAMISILKDIQDIKNINLNEVNEKNKQEIIKIFNHSFEKTELSSNSENINNSKQNFSLSYCQSIISKSSFRICHYKPINDSEFYGIGRDFSVFNIQDNLTIEEWIEFLNQDGLEINRKIYDEYNVDKTQKFHDIVKKVCLSILANQD